MAATIIDIARKAGVGEATVVRTLRGTGYVSAATRARVLKAAAEVNYHANHIARSLVLGKSAFVGMVTPRGVLSVFDPDVGPIEQSIRAAGYSMLLYQASGAGPDAEKDCIEELINKRVAGAVINPVSLAPNKAHYQMLLDQGVKLVVMDRTVEGLETPQVLMDHYASSRLTTEHLISLGHRDIVYLSMPENSQAGRDRAAGFRDTMKAAGIPVKDSSVIEVDYSEDSGLQAGVRLLERDPLPTAAIVRHDIPAIGVMRALLAAGVSIPGDISIAAHGDIWPSHALLVPLTTVHAPVHRTASVAIEKLLQMLAGEHVPPVTTVLDVHLVVRASTGPPRSGA